MDPDGGGAAPQRGLPLPGIDLNDADAMADARPVSIATLRKKRKIGSAAPENANHQNKRRKTTTYLDVSASSSALSSPDASNDASMAQAVRRMLSSSESRSGTSTPLSSSSGSGMRQGHKMIKVDDCVMCCASALNFKGLDMVRVPTYVTEWIHAHLSEHKWDSIWKDLEAFSKYLCATAVKNNIDLYFMKAEDWLDHYLNETRDQYVWLAHNQIEYRVIHQTLKDSLLYEPEGTARLAFAHQNSKHTLEYLKANLKLNDKAAEMAKATLSGGNNSQVDNARRSTIVSYILTNASK